MESPGSPRELLVFSLCWNSEEVIPAKESLNNRIDELASKNEGKQAKSKTSNFHFLFYGPIQKIWPRFRVVLLTSKDPDLGQVFPPQMIYSEKRLACVPRFLGFS